MRIGKLWLGLAGGGILLVGLIAGALISGGLPAWAANAFPGQVLTTPAPSANGQYCQAYLQALASDLHVSPSTLAQANQAAVTTTIQQAFKDGQISQAEETRLLNQVKSATTRPCAFDRLGRGFGGGLGAARPQLQGARTAIATAVANKLSLTATTLDSDLRSGQSISQIAQSQHVALTGSNGLNAVYLAAVQQQLSKAVTGGLITQAQSTNLYQLAQQGVASGHYLLLDSLPLGSGHGSHRANPSQTQPPTTQS